MGILRLSHVELGVDDLELCAAYYVEVLGLIEVAREPDRVYLKCWDEHEHHSVVLTHAPRCGLEHAGFKVEREEDLDDLERAVESWGGAVERMAAGEELGQGEAIRFETPAGHQIELVHRMDKVGNLLPKTNPPPHLPDLVGIHPPHIEHIFITAGEVDQAADFFTQVLGFRLTEQVLADDGPKLAAWLERSHTPCDLALTGGPDGGLHHLAFWADDYGEVRRAADVLAYHGIRIDVGPTRHGATRGQGVYFFDPAGNSNGVFTGGYRVDPDFEPITWTEEEMGRAIFYNQPELYARFLKVRR